MDQPSQQAELPTVRIAHFSDIHLTVRRPGWKLGDRLSKRVTGWLNLKLLGRAARFRHAEAITDSLLASLLATQADAWAFSGDASTLAFPAELEHAAKRLQVGNANLPPAVAVPGNHDYYLASVVRDQVFEAAFQAWQQGIRIGSYTYPFAVRVGHVWLIAVNSARSTFWVWDATGKVGSQQRHRLRELLQQLAPGPRIVVSHYPICLANDRPEPRWHRLRDWKEMIAFGKEHGISLWLHGHKHRFYARSATAEVPFPTVCAGSATQTRLWGYNLYQISGYQAVLFRYQYDPTLKQFVIHKTTTLNLAGNPIQPDNTS